MSQGESQVVKDQACFLKEGMPSSVNISGAVTDITSGNYSDMPAHYQRQPDLLSRLTESLSSLGDSIQIEKLLLKPSAFAVIYTKLPLDDLFQVEITEVMLFDSEHKDYLSIFNPDYKQAMLSKRPGDAISFKKWAESFNSLALPPSLDSQKNSVSQAENAATLTATPKSAFQCYWQLLLLKEQPASKSQAEGRAKKIDDLIKNFAKVFTVDNKKLFLRERMLLKMLARYCVQKPKHEEQAKKLVKLITRIPFQAGRVDVFAQLLALQSEGVKLIFRGTDLDLVTYNCKRFRKSLGAEGSALCSPEVRFLESLDAYQAKPAWFWQRGKKRRQIAELRSATVDALLGKQGSFNERLKALGERLTSRFSPLRDVIIDGLLDSGKSALDALLVYTSVKSKRQFSFIKPNTWFQWKTNAKRDVQMKQLREVLSEGSEKTAIDVLKTLLSVEKEIEAELAQTKTTKQSTLLNIVSQARKYYQTEVFANNMPTLSNETTLIAPSWWTQLVDGSGKAIDLDKLDLFGSQSATVAENIQIILGAYSDKLKGNAESGASSSTSDSVNNPALSQAPSFAATFDFDKEPSLQVIKGLIASKAFSEVNTGKLKLVFKELEQTFLYQHCFANLQSDFDAGSSAGSETNLMVKMAENVITSYNALLEKGPQQPVSPISSAGSHYSQQSRATVVPPDKAIYYKFLENFDFHNESKLNTIKFLIEKNAFGEKTTEIGDKFKKLKQESHWLYFQASIQSHATGTAEAASFGSSSTSTAVDGGGSYSDFSKLPLSDSLAEIFGADGAKIDKMHHKIEYYRVHTDKRVFSKGRDFKLGYQEDRTCFAFFIKLLGCPVGVDGCSTSHPLLKQKLEQRERALKALEAIDTKNADLLELPSGKTAFECFGEYGEAVSTRCYKASLADDSQNTVINQLNALKSWPVNQYLKENEFLQLHKASGLAMSQYNNLKVDNEAVVPAWFAFVNEGTVLNQPIKINVGDFERTNISALINETKESIGRALKQTSASLRTLSLSSGVYGKINRMLSLLDVGELTNFRISLESELAKKNLNPGSDALASAEQELEASLLSAKKGLEDSLVEIKGAFKALEQQVNYALLLDSLGLSEARRTSVGSSTSISSTEMTIPERKIPNWKTDQINLAEAIGEKNIDELLGKLKQVVGGACGARVDISPSHKSKQIVSKSKKILGFLARCKGDDAVMKKVEAVKNVVQTIQAGVKASSTINAANAAKQNKTIKKNLSSILAKNAIKRAGVILDISTADISNRDGDLKSKIKAVSGLFVNDTSGEKHSKMITFLLPYLLLTWEHGFRKGVEAHLKGSYPSFSAGFNAFTDLTDEFANHSDFTTKTFSGAARSIIYDFLNVEGVVKKGPESGIGHLLVDLVAKIDGAGRAKRAEVGFQNAELSDQVKTVLKGALKIPGLNESAETAITKALDNLEKIKNVFSAYTVDRSEKDLQRALKTPNKACSAIVADCFISTAGSGADVLESQVTCTT